MMISPPVPHIGKEVFLLTHVSIVRLKCQQQLQEDLVLVITLSLVRAGQNLYQEQQLANQYQSMRQLRYRFLKGLECPS